MKQGYVIVLMATLLCCQLVQASEAQQPVLSQHDFSELIYSDDVQRFASYINSHPEELNRRLYNDRPLLLYAAFSGAVNIVEFLLMRGVDTTVTDALGRNVWHAAMDALNTGLPIVIGLDRTQEKVLAILRLLAHHQVPGINEKNHTSDEEVPLVTSPFITPVMMRFLLDNGADITVMMPRGGSILSFYDLWRSLNLMDEQRYKQLKAIYEEYMAKAEKQKKGC